MTPTPPSTTSGTSPDNPDGQYKVVRKRNRVPLSCAACRHRKLKCNRAHPSCDNCVKRGDASGCSYAAPGARKKNSQSSQSGNSPGDMQNRIDRLEGLVLSLMTNGQGSAGSTAAQQAISASTSNASPLSVDGTRHNSMQEATMSRDEGDDGDSDVESVSKSFGVMKVDNEREKVMYLGDSHWHLMLADIAEVKSYFANHTRELDAQYAKVASSNSASNLSGPASLIGMHAPATESELRAALPDKTTIEKLVSRYFNSNDTAVHILHYPTFQKQLSNHFRFPSKTSVIWLALLNSVLCLAMQSYNKFGDEPPEWKGGAHPLACEYRMRTVQCLVLSDYTKPVENTIEALLLYVHGEYTLRCDAEVGIWIIVGNTIRLAMRMGYHRDAKHFPGITPFKGEMRRRVWAFLRMLDTMFSFQLALPAMIRARDCDTEAPRNIFEDEFGEDSNELPDGRSNSEPTPISYMLAKLRLCVAFGDVVEEFNAVGGRHVGYDEVMRWDGILRTCRQTLPAHLQLRPLEDSLHDPAMLLMERYSLDILYQKALCVLHRKYLVRARTNSRYAHSRRACVDAGMEILRHQATLHRESQTGGRMQTLRWFISSLTKNDYLLGAMIVCLDLNYDSLAEPYHHNRFFWTADQQKEMYNALQTSQSIWALSAETNMEAYKASRILLIMLEKLRSARDQSQNQQRGRPEPTTTHEAFAAFDEAQPEHSAAMTLGMLSSGGMTPNTAAMFANAGVMMTPGGRNVDMSMADGGFGGSGLTPNFMDTSGGMYGTGNVSTGTGMGMGSGSLQGIMDMPSALDWDAWDSYVQNGSALDPSLQFGTYNSMPGYTMTDSNIGDGNGNGNVNGIGLQAPIDDANNNFGGDGVFMGANTPGRMQ